MSDEGLVAEASKNCRTLFFALLGVCGYVGLVVAETTDSNLLLNDTAYTLPLLGASVPVVSFLYVAPVVVLCSYLYFHFYLHLLWSRIGALPAGSHANLYPWLLNEFAAHVVKNTQAAPANGHTSLFDVARRSVVIALAWGAGPLCIWLVWGRAIARHDPTLTWTHVVLLTMATLMGMSTYTDAVRALMQAQTSGIRAHARAIWVTVSVASVLIALSYQPLYWHELKSMSQVHGFPFNLLWGYHPFAQTIGVPRGTNLTGIDLSNRHLEGAIFAGANLQGADLRSAFLVDADLEDAILKDADLTGAKLASAFGLTREQVRSACSTAKEPAGRMIRVLLRDTPGDMSSEVFHLRLCISVERRAQREQRQRAEEARKQAAVAENSKDREAAKQREQEARRQEEEHALRARKGRQESIGPLDDAKKVGPPVQELPRSKLEKLAARLRSATQGKSLRPSQSPCVVSGTLYSFRECYELADSAEKEGRLEDALSHFLASCKAGEPYSCYRAAEHSSYESRAELLLEACNGGVPLACNAVARSAWEQGKHTVAGQIAEWVRARNSKSVTAFSSMIIGWCRLFGRCDFQADAVAAERHLKEACNAQPPVYEGCGFLGFKLLVRDNKPRDALTYLRKACLEADRLEACTRAADAGDRLHKPQPDVVERLKALAPPP